MTENDHVNQICVAINRQIETVLVSDSFKNWIDEENCQNGDIIVFNNSFLFREGIKTKKHSKYLSVPMGATVPERSASIAYPGSMNSKFKRFVDRGENGIRTEDLAQNVAVELDNVGVIVRALIGRIGDDEPAVVAVEKVKGCRAIRYDPDLSAPATIEDEIISINRIDDVDAAWQAIEATARDEGIDFPERLTENFEKKFSELREEAYRPINIDDLSDNEATMLGEITERIDQQVDDYSRALRAYQAGRGDADALKELLRIAYNFADGIQTLISLMIGISDMKPIVFRLTIGDQFNLADKFGELPFSLVGKAKPSIGRYRSVIAGARNRSFHDIFALGRPFRIRLTGDAFQTAELRLFREHASRREPALDFADRELVELLESFTRAPEQPVPRGFWEKNQEVMEAMARPARSLRAALLLLSP